ncbi:SdrD B-like domain-containing protein [Kitasatospora sp. NPDC057542]|uniref:SdrD B-like domain-containing protein n=1 Tax=Kitasatospora sp. NPDC057542 TaxID=3346162 RepID=UPI0036BC395A
MATALGLFAGTLLTGTLTAPTAEAAVGFTKTVDKPTVAPGENVTYTLRYTCSVTDCANGRITDALPAGMEFVGWTPDASTVDVAGSTVPAAGTLGGTLDIKLLTLTPGTTATVKVVLRFPNFTTPNGTKTVNSATLTADGEPAQNGSAATTAAVQPDYRVTKGVQTSSQDGRSVTYQFSACSTSGVPNVDLDAGRLVDTLPPGAVVDTGRSPGWTQDPADPDRWTFDIGDFRAGNGQAGCRNPGVLVVNYPDPAFPSGTTSTNSVVLQGDPLGPEGMRDLSEATAESPTFKPPTTGIQVAASKTWQDKVVSGDIASFSLHPGNIAGPATRLVMTDPGSGTTSGLYNWLIPQSIQLEAWNPTGIGLTLRYRLDGDPTWRTFTPGKPFDGSSSRRITFAEGAGNPANDELGIPAGRRLDGLRFEWNGPIPTGWSPGNAVQVLSQVVTPGHDGRTAPGPLHNCVDVTGTDATGATSSASDCADTTVSAATNLGAAKTTTSGEVLAPGGTATFRVTPYNRTGRTLGTPLVMYDLLPPGLVYQDGSARRDPGYTGSVAPQSVRVLPGPDGRQLLKLTWPAGAPDMTYLNDQKAYRTLIDVQVAGSAKPGTLTNDVYVTTEGAEEPVACSYFGTDSGTPDTHDLNGNGNTTETVCHASSKVEVQVPAVLRSFKEVKGDLDQDYATTGTTTPGGGLSYRLTVRNDSPDPVTDFVAYDKLPTPGDSYLLRPDVPRGSAWTPSLTRPLTSSDPTVAIEYTTSPNPCVTGAITVPGPCDANARWSTDFPGPGNATWFKVGRPGTLPSGGLFTLTWPMVASVDAGNADFAWNSFAYTATDSTGSPLLPAEPAKVGVGVQAPAPPNNALGDHAWADRNGNGIQEPGENGVPGVRVELLDGTGQPVREKTGKPVTTVTDADGNYLFDKLPDGEYAVRFDLTTVPADAKVTVRHAGKDSALDSDADPATGVTQTVRLSGGARDLSLDLGLVLADAPTPTPTPTDSPSPTSSPTPTDSPSPTGSPTPTDSPTNSPSPSNSPSAGPSNSPSAGPTNGPSSSEPPSTGEPGAPSHDPQQPSPGQGGSELPHTGGPGLLPAVLGAAALGFGVLFTVVARRRRGRHS